MNKVKVQEGKMMDMKGHKTEAKSRKLEAKSIYSSLTPNLFSSGYWLLNTGSCLLLFVLFLLATLAPVEFPLSKGGERGLLGLGVVDAFAADNSYFTSQELAAMGQYVSILYDNEFQQKIFTGWL